ncbi:MAG: hypothetical protein ACRETY_11025 [Steroidobacteraceae bacterium]
MVGVLLVIASVLFLAVTWPLTMRFAIGILGASIAQALLGLLLLGGPGATFITPTSAYGDLPGIPRPLIAPAWVVGASYL